MKFVCNVSLSNEDWNVNCDGYFVNVTKEVAQRFLKYRKAYAAAKAISDGIYSLEYFDYGADAFHMFDGAEKYMTWDTFRKVPEKFSIPDDALESIECSVVKVLDNGVMFSAFVKHTNVEVTSPVLEWKIIEKIANEKEKPKKPRKPKIELV